MLLDQFFTTLHQIDVAVQLGALVLGTLVLGTVSCLAFNYLSDRA